jgi:hypothetical protein
MIQKLPNNLVNCCQLRTFHLLNCNYLQLFFDLLSHGLNMLISIDMKKLFTSIGKLNALLVFNLSECSNLQELPTYIGQLITLQELNLSGCSSLQKLPTSIGQLSAF